MAAYKFTLTCVGEGASEEEAWEDIWQYVQERAQKGDYDKAERLDDDLALLGPLRELYDAAVSPAYKALLLRMATIDSRISCSKYLGVSEDRPPTGDDYNLLWDAILDSLFPVT